MGPYQQTNGSLGIPKFEEMKVWTWSKDRNIPSSESCDGLRFKITWFPRMIYRKTSISRTLADISNTMYILKDLQVLIPYF